MKQDSCCRGIIYSSELIHDTDAVLELFRASGWQEDADFNMISSAFVTGLYCSAWHEDKLIGLARCLSDGAYSAIIDVVVVHPDYRGLDIGFKLVRSLIDSIGVVKYISVSPNGMSVSGFYEKLGFRPVKTGGLLQIVR